LIKNSLAPLGEIIIETYGCSRSYTASRAGGGQHFTFLETEKITPFYFPTLLRGEALKNIIKPYELMCHRLDGSPAFFDLFAKYHTAHNIIINGSTGSGKSVFANLIGKALLNDSNNYMVKVDVGGSYENECELNNGKSISFSLNSQSGVNPFVHLNKTNSNNDTVSIVSEFLFNLIKENNEQSITKELRYEIERSIKAYIGKKPEDPSIDNFLSTTKDIPRKNLLKRWATGGVFENALKASGDNLNQIDRYTYFNFKHIHSAANEDYSSGIMAAVIAETNLKALGLKQDSRMIFFCDEVPFFIKKNGSFFKLTTANFRKYGHSTILIAQSINDFELTSSSNNADYGIINNSPIRFLFQIDGDEFDFGQILGITNDDISKIKNLNRSQDYKECVLIDNSGSKTLRIKLTKDEYWNTTTSKPDKDKLLRLRSLLPELSLKEAINCLSHGLSSL